jgi:PAS domain S-box-containing protein
MFDAALKAISGSDAAVRDIIASFPHAFLILDKDLRVTSANQAFCQQFRVSAAQTEGFSLSELGNRQWDVSALRIHLENAISDGTSADGFEVPHDFPSIGQRIMSVKIRAIAGPGFEEKNILFSIEDISEQHSVRSRSDNNQHLFQSVVDTIRDPLAVIEADTTIALANKAFLKLFGITDAAVRGQRLADVGEHQWNVPALRLLMDEVLPQDKTIENFEVEDEFPGLGRRVFNLNVRKISQPGNHTHRMLVVFEDITDRRQRERDAKILANEISHRVKNNLQLIIGLISFEIRSAPEPYADGYKAMQARIRAIAELYDLISRSGYGKTVALDSYLREIVSAMSTTLLSEVSDITIEVEAETLELDPDRAVPFGLLVNELTTNAFKHAFPGKRGCVVLGLTRLGDQIELTVADNGIGMAGRPSTLQTRSRGTDYIGIFVRQLRATIATSKSAGGGTTIKVLMPLS